MLTEVAPGVHQLEYAYVNCYIVEEDGKLLVVDAGLPGVWMALGEAIRSLGYRPTDIAAVALTHAHFDHIGVARRLQEELRIPIWLHREDFYIAAHPYRYAHESPRALYPLRHPGGIPMLFAMARAGALRVRAVRGLLAYDAGEVLPVPGAPRVLFTPGHTYGHCVFHLSDRGVLFSGDALVTLDPYTGSRGPQIIAGAATADSDLALESLGVLADTGAAVVLPGHGSPWTEGIDNAVREARTRGPH